MKIIKKALLISTLSYLISFSTAFAGGIDHFEVKFTPETAKVGESLDLSIEAVDKNNVGVTDYEGTVLIFSESDPEAELPITLEENTYTFKASDQGKIIFENSIKFLERGTQNIHVYDFQDDTVFGIAEAEITKVETVESLNVDIISPENGLTIGENSIKVSGTSNKNHQIKILLNETEEFLATTNNEGVYEKEITSLQEGENIFKAQVLDADSNVVGESKEIKIMVEGNTISLKNIKTTPEEVAGESAFEVEIITNPGLSEVSTIINDVITNLEEESEGKYIAKIYAPKEEGTYKIDVILKDELGHESKELGAGSIKVSGLNSAASENEKELSKWDKEIQKLIKDGCESIQFDVDGNTCGLNQEKTDYQHCTEMLTTKQLELPICTDSDKTTTNNTKKELKITGLKLVELKTRSILTWDKIEGAKSYNVYKKLENGNLELVENVVDSRFEIAITGDEVKYDYFAVKAMSETEEGEVYEGDLSEATKVKTGPELIILLIISLFFGGLFIIRQKRA